MSLLIFGSANRIGQGILYNLLKQNSFQKVICADLYPTYSSIQRFLPLKTEITANYPNTKLEDIKIQDKSDLSRAISNSSHFVYITHDYYSTTPSKLNLVTLSAELSKKFKLEKFIAVAPVEHDHFNEENPISDSTNSLKQAFEKNPDSIILNSDITFGYHSTFCDAIIRKLVNKESIYFDPKYIKELSPIHVDDLANIVNHVLNNNIKGVSYSVGGNNKVTLGSMLSTLQRYAGEDAVLNQNWLHRLVPPTHLNLVSEQLYPAEDINLFSFIKKYTPPIAFERFKDFTGELKNFEDSYPDNGILKRDYTNFDNLIEKKIKSILD